MALTSSAAEGSHVDTSDGGWDSLRTIDERVQVSVDDGSDLGSYEEDESDSLYERPRIEISEPFWDDEYDFQTESSEFSDAQVDRHGPQLGSHGPGSSFQESDDHREINGILSRLHAVLRLSSFKFKRMFPSLFRWLSIKLASSRPW